MPIAIGADHLDIAIPSQWRDQEWQHLIDQLPDQHRTIRLHPAIEADLQRALATETDQPTTEPNPPAAEQSSNPAPAKTASTLDLNAESFLHDFSPDEVLESDEDDDAQLARDAIDLETSLKDAEASPVVTLVDRILLQAMSVGASDIHVEPQQKGLRLRFRQDGVLQQCGAAPQSPGSSGDIPLQNPGGSRHCRTAPGPGRPHSPQIPRPGDRFPRQHPAQSLRGKGLSAPAGQWSDPTGAGQADRRDALALVRELGSKPFGMILVTGPTGSGKSTTLYSLLAERNDPGINISTVEDPIEYTLPGITQCQVNRDKGFDFATALRQDPDVLLVGETRDLETAKTAIEAALTGHLTLHANDAPSTIARLDEMGVEPFMVSASLIGIISQRLLRRVCSHCREPYRPEER